MKKGLNRRMEKNRNMRKIYNVLAVLVLIFGPLFIAGTPLASAQVQQWAPETGESIQQEFDKNIINDDIRSYTTQWGDTLDTTSLASDTSIERLMKFNKFNNERLIEVGVPTYFNQSKQSMALENNQAVNLNTVGNPIVEVSQDNNNVPNEVLSKRAFELLDGHTTTPHTQEPSEEIVLPKPQEVQQEVSKQEIPNQEVQQVQPEVVEQVVPTTSPKLYTLRQLMFDGVIHWNGLKFTYYSQSVLPGGGLNIPGRHVNADGYVADGDGYIVLANNAPLGTIINTPFGYKGKVYDRGTVGNHFDVYIR